jgi:ABC-type uncharacterized transport system permease subunit
MLAVLGKKVQRAFFSSLLTEGLGWTTLMIVAKVSDWNIVYMMFGALGAAFGDAAVALRKSKKKTKPRSKVKSPKTSNPKEDLNAPITG